MDAKIWAKDNNSYRIQLTKNYHQIALIIQGGHHHDKLTARGILPKTIIMSEPQADSVHRHAHQLQYIEAGD